MGKFYNSVRLNEDLCMGCINCIKRCPTEAIRVRDGKAVITKKFCIDCGECIRHCPHHAKQAMFDEFGVLNDYEYTVALPAPSLYGQFNNLEDTNIVLSGLKLMGFDDVYEVAGAAEIVSELSREYVSANRDKWPVISCACPTVVRLISVRFPNLIEHLLPVKPPVEVAASAARKLAVKKTGLPEDKIGIIFISPCPAKVSAVHDPVGFDKSDIDAVLAIKDVYPKLVKYMSEAMEKDRVEELSIAGKIGIGWGNSGGEAGGLITDSYLAADGIENVIRVLEDLEDQKFSDLSFIELDACSGGCVGGVLTVENPYVARVKIKQLRKYLPVAKNRAELYDFDISEMARWTKEPEYDNVFSLGTSVSDSMRKMSQVYDLCREFPGLDCGACGAPTCKALAEDIVRGKAQKTDCVHILRKMYEEVSNEG